MAGTTTLKLSDNLKARIAPLAERAGQTPHAWMVEALERQVGLAEMRHAFIAQAEAAARGIDAGAPLYAAEDVHAYLLDRASGKRSTRPPAVRRARRPKSAQRRTK
jgi:predicted transcriptional regulator